MKRILLSLTTAALLFGSALPAEAQWFNPGPMAGPYGPAMLPPARAPISYRPARRFPLVQQLLQAAGGLNVNIIRNSGNGVGNSIFTNNYVGLPGGINLNVISGSGNGANNSIGIGNRR